VVERTK